jgi:hypothetical protein
MACETISWITGRSLSLGRTDTAEHWTRTFEYRCYVAITCARLWREVVVEEPEITEEHNDHAGVPTSACEQVFQDDGVIRHTESERIV